MTSSLDGYRAMVSWKFSLYKSMHITLQDAKLMAGPNVLPALPNLEIHHRMNLRFFLVAGCYNYL